MKLYTHHNMQAVIVDTFNQLIHQSINQEMNLQIIWPVTKRQNRTRTNKCPWCSAEDCSRLWGPRQKTSDVHVQFLCAGRQTDQLQLIADVDTQAEMTPQLNCQISRQVHGHAQLHALSCKVWMWCVARLAASVAQEELVESVLVVLKWRLNGRQHFISHCSGASGDADRPARTALP